VEDSLQSACVPRAITMVHKTERLRVAKAQAVRHMREEGERSVVALDGLLCTMPLYVQSESKQNKIIKPMPTARQNRTGGGTA